METVGLIKINKTHKNKYHVSFHIRVPDLSVIMCVSTQAIQVERYHGKARRDIQSEGGLKESMVE